MDINTDSFYWKNTWDAWDARVIIFSSLFLQTFLLFSGPLRKRTQRGFVSVLIWAAYILSPFICTYGFGLITASIVDPAPTTTHAAAAPAPAPAPTPTPTATATTVMTDRVYSTHPYLLGIWSPFLLLHLSRPDTITALSIADNELWLRKTLYINLYSYYVSRMITLSAYSLSTSPDSNFWIPAVIVYIIGIKRYVKWINTLFFATTVGTDCYLPERPLLATTQEDFVEDLSDLQVLKHAYGFFTRFKGLIVDYSFTFLDCSKSRDDFVTKLTPKDAFRVVERELNFFYEFLYTKAWISQTKSANHWRIGEFGALLVALVLFYKEDKSIFKNNDIDIKITYLLLGGSILLEATAMIMVLSSDWFVAHLKSRGGLPKEIGMYLEIFKTWWPKIVHRKWSNSLPQYNLIKYSLRHKKERSDDSDIIITMALKTIESIRFVETLKFDEIMRDFIIAELKIKSSLSNNPSTAREIQSARGDWVIRYENCIHLLRWINECDFDQILLTWHVATDICFYTDNSNKSNDCNISKRLSDYMFYLLIWQPEMMSSVDARGEKRFKATCAEVRKFFLSKNIRVRKGGRVEVPNGACENILSNYTNVENINSTGKDVNGVRSVLMDARDLAEKLRELESIRKWEILSKVWCEMLCYAASHCKAIAHMKQVQQGGQLITFVWLLMVHFAIVN